MNINTTPSPGSPAADLLDARRLALLDRQLERLDQLVGAGMGMVEGLAAQASGAGPAVVQGDVILAYSRAARAVRMAILLQTHLVADCGAARNAAGRTAAAGAGADQDAETLADQDRDPPETAAHREGERAERLERDDIYRLVQTRPAEELVAEIANDLGLSPDWPQAADDCDGDDLPRSRQRSAGGGPPADPGVQPGEERGVEGAVFKRSASASPVSDSS